MTISLRPASPATADKILDAVRAELQPLLAAGRPFHLELHGGPDKHVRLVVTSYVDVNPVEAQENAVQRRR
jgi:hypothetical protein